MINARLLYILIFSLAGISCLFAQDRKALEAEKAKLKEQITLTTQRIQTTAKNIDAAVRDVRTLEAEVNARKNMVHTLEKEMALLDDDLARESGRLEESKGQLESLKTNYEELMRNAYLSKLVESPMLFMLSAGNLNQAYQRWLYLRQLERHRRRQFDQLVAQQDSIIQIMGRIEDVRSDKISLHSDVETQQKEFRQAAGAKESLIKKLKSDEQQLRKRLKEQEAESKRLAEEIDRIIREEMARKSTAEGLPSAPELQKLTAAFHENKGNLPWPVKKGVVTSKFGKQPHPVLRSIEITNNGIDFAVEGGTQVLAVFEGVVVGKKFIPGFDEMVIIQHGSFYTVYSRLAKTFVEKGDKVTTQQVIGRVNASSEKAELHFELWQEKTLQNPESWISG